MYGQSSFEASINLSELNGQNGFLIEGLNTDDSIGGSVSRAGDINNDGIDDLVIGGSGGGDINNDGIADVVIGAIGAEPNGVLGTGAAYVVFGQSSFTATIDLARLDGTNGFAIFGGLTAEIVGTSVGTAVDINQDGFDDVIIGAPTIQFPPYLIPEDNPRTYIILGQSTFDASINLKTLDSRRGVFGIRSLAELDGFGGTLSGVSDVNADGIDDFAIGATSGLSYIVFGRANWLSSADPSCGKPGFNPSNNQGIFLWQDCPDGSPNGDWHLLATGGNTSRALRYNGVLQGESAIEATPVRYERSDILRAESTAVVFVMRLLKTGVDGFDFSTEIGTDLCLDVGFHNRINTPIFLGAGRQALPNDAPVNITTGERCVLAPPYDTCGVPRFDGTAGLFVWQACGTDTWRIAAVSDGRRYRFDGSSNADTSLSNIRPIRFENDDTYRLLSPDAVAFDMRVGNGDSDTLTFNTKEEEPQTLCLRLNRSARNTDVFVGRNNTLRPFQNGAVDLLSTRTCAPVEVTSN